jgi:hypothetical protein
MKRIVLAGIVTGAVAMALTHCGGTTGQDQPPAQSSPGGPDATTGLDATADAGSDDALYTDLFDVEVGFVDQVLPTVSAPDGGEAGVANLPLPCTMAGQTGCVQCDANADGGLCTPTEAIILTRDIEKGLYKGNLPGQPMAPTADGGPDGGFGGGSPGSCYECMAVSDCIDSTALGYLASGLECGDLTPMSSIQPCLDTLNCILGSPQTGTAGATGEPSASATPASLSMSCSNTSGAVSSATDAGPNASAPNDGAFNCFCGLAEPDVNDCGKAATVASLTTSGGPGVASPNGLCIPQILAGLGDLPGSPNSTIIKDLANVNLGAGLAFSIAICAGSNQTAGQACPQCYQ